MGGFGSIPCSIQSQMRCLSHLCDVVAPGDVYWDNLSILWWERILRQIGVTIIVIGLIVAWVIPIAASAAFFNASNLVQYQAFEWIERIPKWLLSGIQGVLPFAIGQIFLALLPIILR